MNRKASTVRFQTIIHLIGVGDLGLVLPSPTKNLDNLTMSAHGADGVLVSFLWQGLKKEVWIPSSNVVMAVLEENTSRIVKA